MDILQKIKNIIKVGNKTKSVDNQFIEVEFLGKKQNVLMLNPYGIMSNPKNDNMVVLFQQEGMEDSLFGIVNDVNNRDDLDIGDFQIGVPSKTTRIKLSTDNKITFVFDQKNATDFAVRFNELKTGFDELKRDYNNFVSTKYNTHTHDVASIQSGTSTATASPTSSSGSQSSASIDDAKISDIKMPEK